MPDEKSNMPALQTWEAIAQTPDLVNYFQGIFNKAGITVEETGESFTAIHDGQVIALTPGIDDDVDYIVPLRQENIDNLVSHAADGVFDPDESWRIIKMLFTPLTQTTLSKSVLNKAWLRQATGAESLIHVHLLSPSGEEAATHTLAYAGHQWLVLPGLHGDPERSYYLSPEEALVFQKRLFEALQTDTFSEWWHFANWYREWRISVSTL